MDDIADLETQVKEYQVQLETADANVQADPDNEDYVSLRDALRQGIATLEEAISELRVQNAPVQSSKPVGQSPNSQPSSNGKWSKEGHSGSQPGFRKSQGSQVNDEGSRPQNTYAMGENVLAKWVSGDNAFYPARITSITGSTANPIYIVTFKSYGTTETVSAKDLRPATNESKKRKADGSPVTVGTPSHTPTPTNSNVISAAANINPDLADKAKREPNKPNDGSSSRPAKIPKKVGKGKELEASKAKWKEWASGKKMTKFSKRESMFRTPEGVNARVGFTGSGQEMRKDPSRSRHVYKQAPEDDVY